VPCSSCQRAGLLNHPIRSRPQRGRDRQAEGLSGLEINDEIELRRLLDGKVWIETDSSAITLAGWRTWAFLYPLRHRRSHSRAFGGSTLTAPSSARGQGKAFTRLTMFNHERMTIVSGKQAVPEQHSSWGTSSRV